MIHITHEEATKLIAEVYDTLFNGTDTFDGIGTPLAYLLGDIAMLANSPNQEDPRIFDASPGACDEHDVLLVNTMRQLFQADHLVWKFIKVTGDANQDDDARSLAFEACRQLVAAYQAGEDNGGSMEWSDVDAAWELAKQALGIKDDE